MAKKEDVDTKMIIQDDETWAFVSSLSNRWQPEVRCVRLMPPPPPHNIVLLRHFNIDETISLKIIVTGKIIQFSQKKKSKCLIVPVPIIIIEIQSITQKHICFSSWAVLWKNNYYSFVRTSRQKLFWRYIGIELVSWVAQFMLWDLTLYCWQPCGFQIIIEKLITFSICTTCHTNLQ